MLPTRVLALAALALVTALAGCRHTGGCPSCSSHAAVPAVTDHSPVRPASFTSTPPVKPTGTC